MTTAASSSASSKSITTPPSFLFPLGAGLLAYFISEKEGKKSIWAAVAGVFMGALFNEAVKNAAMKVNIVQMQGGKNFSINTGTEALSAVLGTSDDDRFTSPHIQVGDQVLAVPAPGPLVSGDLVNIVGLSTIVGDGTRNRQARNQTR